MIEEYLTRTEARTFLRTSKTTLYRWVPEENRRFAIAEPRALLIEKTEKKSAVQANQRSAIGGDGEEGGCIVVGNLEDGVEYSVGAFPTDDLARQSAAQNHEELDPMGFNSVVVLPIHPPDEELDE